MDSAKQTVQPEVPAQPKPRPFLERLFRIPEGQSLIWWMIDTQRGTLKQIIAFVAFILLFRFAFGTWSLSIAMVVSMFLHECGHAFVFWLTQIRFVVMYLFPLGAVAAPVDKAEDARSDLLHWNTISWLLQAGPAVNVALIVIFTLMQPTIVSVGGEAWLLQFARDMVYANSLLAAMNLVPVWTLDAGQLFKMIYNSLEEHEDRWVTGILVGSSAVLLLGVIGIPGFLSWVAILSNVLFRFGWIVFIIIFVLGVLNQQGLDEPKHAYSRQAMTNFQVLVHLAFYVLLVMVTLWVAAGRLL